MAQADGLECSLCLEHGLWRKCCGEAFCKHCYTQYSRCPNCNTAVDGMGEPIIAEPEQKTGEELKEEAAANSEGFLMDAAAGIDQKRLDAQQEQEECRTCLGPGFRRKCCSEYYCNDCYFRTRKCPGCGAKIMASGLSGRGMGFDPGTVPVVVSYLITIGAVLATGGLCALVYFADARYIETAFGFTCYGLFPPCDIEICIDYVHEASSWERGELVMPTLADWRYCDIHSEKKVRGMACIYDHSLYRQSEKALGFDFCVGENAAAQPVKPEWRGGSLWGIENPSAEFNGGMCVLGETGGARARDSRASVNALASRAQVYP